MQMPSTTSPKLVTAEACIREVFGTVNAPSLRTFRGWQAKGFIPVHKIGHRTFFDPEQVRFALDRRFKIEARNPNTTTPKH